MVLGGLLLDWYRREWAEVKRQEAQLIPPRDKAMGQAF